MMIMMIIMILLLIIIMIVNNSDNYINNYILTDKRNATTKNQSCFIQAVISSNYVEINQQKLLAVSCFERLSNCVQRYHQPGVNQGRNLTSRMFEFEFPDYLDTLKDKERTR